MASENYFGNPNLKRIGVAIDYTEEQILEIKKCSEDYKYFIDNYCYIVTVDSGLQPFKLWKFQKTYLDILHNNRKIIVKFPRQTSKTTTAAAYFLWHTLFSDNKTVAVLANKEDAAMETLSRYQIMYENLPLWLQQGVKTWNKGSIELENGSKVITAATTSSGIRGKTISILYIDEAAIIPNNIADAFLTSVFPVVSSGTTTKILISSTPRGYNHFWKLWNDAKEGRNGFITYEIHYSEVPGKNKKWAEEQRKTLGDVGFAQEVLCLFNGSSYTLINAETIGQLSYSTPLLSDSGLDIYEYPIHRTLDSDHKVLEYEHGYILVADTSKGVGGDYSAFTVIDITQMPYRIVAKYRDNTISPLLYPSIIYKVARQYNNAFVLLEINFSDQVAHILYSDYEYENILFVTKDNTQQRISNGFAGASTALGVSTDKKVKRIGCSNFKALIEEKKLLIPDADIISELSTFIQVKDSYAADEGYNDDLVMTLVLFGWLTTSMFFKEVTDMNLRQALYQERIQKIEDDFLPILRDDGIDSGIYHDTKDVWFDYGVFNSNIYK